MPEQNLARRAGSWSAAHWKTSTGAWLALVFVAMAAGSAVGLNKLTDSQSGSGETARAQQILRSADFLSPATESVLIERRDGSRIAGTRGFDAAVASLVRTLSLQPDVTHIRSPLDPGGEALVAPGGKAALVQFDVRGDADHADARIAPVMEAVATVQSRNPSFRIEEFGLASADHVLSRVVNTDFRRAEYTSLPITLAILLIAFGALVAALLPVVLAFTAVLGAIGLTLLISHGYALPDFLDSVILMMGMAVGVDYSLFYLQREREERRANRPTRDALLTAASTSGRAVLVSGLTVLIAMAGLFFAGNPIFSAMGLATMVVVFLAMIGSVTVLPALLSKLGDNVDRGRVPFLRRKQPGRFWETILRPVLHRPGLSAALAAALLFVLALPLLTMHTKLPSFTDLPRNVAIVHTYDRIVRAFPGSPAPAVVVVHAQDVRAAAVQTQVRRLERRALASGQVRPPISARISPDRTVEEVDLPLVGTGDNRTSVLALRLLRNRLLPATVGTVAGVDYATTGVTAATEDFNSLMKARLPYVFAFVLGLAFILLLVTFRSLVIPFTAIALNLLSVGASYGLLVLVFQHHWAEGVLGFSSNGGITSWLPMFLFVVLFGLSMDYYVFIVSRIRELADRGENTRDAVFHGIVRTAPSVTSAAGVMVAVFAIFATLSLLQFKQLGFGLAVAIALDATIVRAVLLPATMTLLGDWNWYLPTWLEWLPGGRGSSGQRERKRTVEPTPAQHRQRVSRLGLS